MDPDPQGCFSLHRGLWNQDPSFFAFAYKQSIAVGSITFETQFDTGALVGTPSLTRIEDISKDQTPLSMAITPFHILVLYRDRIVAINRRSFKEVHEVTLSEMEVVGEPISLIRDEGSEKIWLSTQKSIFALVMKNETRNEWLYCLEQNLFAEAFSFCTVRSFSFLSPPSFLTSITIPWHSFSDHRINSSLYHPRTTVKEKR